jgi:pimeloyl-ACP methyl ester carboxylesterase
MYDPLFELLRNRFRMVIPDLRGHGKSGDLDGPYNVAALNGEGYVAVGARLPRTANLSESVMLWANSNIPA